MQLIVKEENGRSVWHVIMTEVEAAKVMADYCELIAAKTGVDARAVGIGFMVTPVDKVEQEMHKTFERVPLFACIWKEVRNGHKVTTEDVFGLVSEAFKVESAGQRTT
ncbi:MAG TPA: hypothetical protein VIV60_30530 [Polyangiaceae bacterium]